MRGDEEAFSCGDRCTEGDSLYCVSGTRPIFVVKNELHLEASLYTLLQILSVTVFEKMPLHQALVDNTLPSNNPINPNQLTLHGI